MIQIIIFFILFNFYSVMYIAINLPSSIKTTNNYPPHHSSNKRYKIHLENRLAQKKNEEIQNIIKNNRSLKKSHQFNTTNSKYLQRQPNSKDVSMKKQRTDKLEEKKYLLKGDYQIGGKKKNNLFHPFLNQISQNKLNKSNKNLKDERHRTKRINKIQTGINEVEDIQNLKTKRRFIYEKEQVESKTRLSMPKMEQKQNQLDIRKQKLRNTVYLDQY